MTDKKLLELAAKAAGIHGESTNYGFKQDDGGPEENPEWILWNPLTDDGDALRLAVKLRMAIYVGDGGSILVETDDYRACEDIDSKQDPHAATRRAIVRAAAEIGKDLK